MLKISRPTVVTAATAEPVSITEAKRHLGIADDDTQFDDELASMIQAAREQWEHDTDSAVLTQTLSVTANYFKDGMLLPVRPVQSLTSITYYDGDNAQQTLSTDIYQLDPTDRRVRLKYLQNWPTVAIRWDAITITFVAGYSALSDVPAIAKQAMLLLIGRWFEDREMFTTSPMMAYEALARRYMRYTYP